VGFPWETCWPEMASFLSGAPRVDSSVEVLIIRMAQENSAWEYKRIAGEMTGRHRRCSIVCRSRCDAPRLDRKLASSTFVSTTHRSHLTALASRALVIYSRHWLRIIQTIECSFVRSALISLPQTGSWG
jgi:hypothetical protein